MRAASWLVCLHTKGTDMFNMNIKREAWGLILRSAQRHFNEGVAATSDGQIHGIKVMTLRLQSNTARELFGTKFLPVIGGNDPIRTQLLRSAHQPELGAGRAMHHLEKTTLANLVRGATGRNFVPNNSLAVLLCNRSVITLMPCICPSLVAATPSLKCLCADLSTSPHASFLMFMSTMFAL